MSADADDSSRHVIVYTDGACEGNGGKKATAGCGVWFPPGTPGVPSNISRPVSGNVHTNNVAELQAIGLAIDALSELAAVAGVTSATVFTDSKYAIGSLTVWIQNWQRNGWRTTSGKPVANRDLIESTHDKLLSSPVRIELRHVPGHAGVVGNEAADQLARDACCASVGGRAS